MPPLLPLARGLQGLILLLRTHCEHPMRRGRLTMRTLFSAGARSAVLRREFDFDHRVASSILGGCPTAAGLSRRTGGALVLPIHDKLGSFEPGLFPRLPVIILARRTTEIDLIVLLTADEFCGIHIARVHDMHAWQQITLCERFMDERNRRIIRHRRGRG